MKVLASAQNSVHNPALLQYTQGVVWDQQLFHQEMRVQHAWIDALADGGHLTTAEHSQLAQQLSNIRNQMQAGTFDWRIEDEDIHMNIERALTDALGDLGKKIHLGRSRNDLIATTLRLHVADTARHINTAVKDLASTLADLAEKNLGLIVPGVTHLQHGQPVALAQILLAHAWPCTRIIKLLALAENVAMEAMPLGAAACSGSTLPLDFGSIAGTLGFASPCRNSYDAVSDRDAILILMQAIALHATHVGRFCEDVIYWASSPVDLLQLPKEWSTGSSIMPNKRNPDVAEITRAKTAVIIANASCAQQLVKALGSSYFSDLHELKKLYLDTVGIQNAIHTVITPFAAALKFCPKAATHLLHKGHILATDLANQQVARGTPFREAYSLAATKVQQAEAAGLQVHQMDGFTFTFSDSVAARSLSGGTSAAAIRQQITALGQLLISEH